MYHILLVSQYWSIFICYKQPTLLRFSHIHVILWDRILLIRIFLNSRVICERMLQIDVLQYRFMLNALIVTDNWNLNILALSIVFMRIVIITYLSFILFRSTRRSSSLSRNFMYVNFITYNHRKSSLMIPFASKSIHCVNLDVSQQVFETSWLQELKHLKP